MEAFKASERELTIIRAVMVAAGVSQINLTNDLIHRSKHYDIDQHTQPAVITFTVTLPPKPSEEEAMLDLLVEKLMAKFKSSGFGRMSGFDLN